MKKNLLIHFLIALVSINTAYSYTKNRAENGRVIKWADGTSNISFVFHPSGLVNEQSAFSQSISQWNSAQAINITSTIGGGSASEDINDVYFSTDASLFSGGGVAAVTNVVYDFSNGEIVEADIIVNQNMLFSGFAGSQDYIGDVLGHELGHAIGLAHSEVKHSTMFYWLTRGQYSLAQDDRAGAYSLYPNLAQAKGKISGRVAGGQNIGVFGAHVQAISEFSGRVIASTLSQSDGTFEIEGLPLEDRYMIYVSPLVAKSTMPAFYADARSDFCSSSSSYRGTFYQSCLSSRQGLPVSIPVTAASPTASTGNISIGCDLEVPQNYMSEKETLFEVESVDVFGNPGNRMVGYFTPDQITSGTQDRLRLDLTSFNTSGSNNLYLEFHITYQSLYSVMHLQAEVERSSVAQSILDPLNGANMVLGSTAVTDNDGNPDMELFGRVSMSSNALDNDFELMIEPQSFEDWDASVAAFSSEDFYSRKTQFKDPLTFYVLTYRVVQNNGGIFSSYASPATGVAADNSTCFDAAGTYKIVGNVEQSSQNKPRRSSDDDGGFACGSVDLGNSGSGGSGFVSFLLGLFMLAVIRRGTSARNNLV